MKPLFIFSIMIEDVYPIMLGTSIFFIYIYFARREISYYELVVQQNEVDDQKPVNDAVSDLSKTN